MVDIYNSCGVCCELFLITLTESEYMSGKYKTQFKEFDIIKDFSKAEDCGANIIEQKDNGSCIYLEEGKCSIHKTRPEACEAFFCNSQEPRFQEMIKDIKKAKK